MEGGGETETLKKLIKQAATQTDREREIFASSLNVTDVQVSVIDFLSDHGNSLASQNEIEHEFNIKRSTTTIMLQRVEKHGSIIRVNDPEDKGKKQAQLTESALGIVPKIRQYMKQDSEEVLGNLPVEDVSIIMAFLENVKERKAND